MAPSPTQADERPALWVAGGLLTPALLVTPLIYGGVMAWTWVVALALVLTAAAILIASDWRSGVLVIARPPVLPFLALVGLVVVLQQVPLPYGLTQALAPGSARVLAEARPELVSEGGWAPLAMDRSHALEGSQRALLYGLGFLLAARLGRDPLGARYLLLLLVGLGCFETFYGLAERFAGENQVFGWDKPAASRGRVSGTYVNPDHYGNLLALALPIPLALAATWREEARVLPRGGAQRWIAILAHPAAPRRLLLAFGGVVLTLGVAASCSRGAALAGTAGLAALVAALSLRRGPRHRALLVGASVVVALVWAGLLGFDRVISRFGEVSVQAEADKGRLMLIGVAFDMVRDFPLLGTGFGAFNGLFPVYNPNPGPWSDPGHVHADWVELMLDLGLPGAVAMALALVRVAWGSLRAEVDDERRGLALAALAGIAAAGVHALLDFSLRLPANALWTACLLGVAWGVTHPEERPWILPGSRLARGGVALALFVPAGLGLTAMWAARADWVARPFVERAAGDDRPQVVQIESLEQALGVWPWEADHWAELGALRYQLALGEELKRAEQAADKLTRAMTSPAAAKRLRDGLIAARLRNSAELRAAQARALEEAERAVRLAPGSTQHKNLRNVLRPR